MTRFVLVWAGMTSEIGTIPLCSLDGTKVTVEHLAPYLRRNFYIFVMWLTCQRCEMHPESKSI